MSQIKDAKMPPGQIAPVIFEKPAPTSADKESHEGSTGADSVEPADPAAQTGVQKIEAITSAWTKTSLIVAYTLVWINFFVMLMQQNALAQLTPFVTSAFAEHSLTATVTVVASITVGVSNLTMAKILDVFGRPQGWLLAVAVTTIGLIMLAACNSVEQYAAAEVFYLTGSTAIFYTLNIVVADTSSLRNRGLMVAFAASPGIITAWVGGPISQAYLSGPGWAWAFGTFSIVVPAVALPLFGLLMYNLIKARKLNIVPETKSRRTLWHSVIHYAREFDAIGLLLLTAGLALFLLPFNIYTNQPQGWRSPLIICFLVFGVALVVLFALWEKWYAPVTFIPYSLLLDRTVLGACVLGFTLFMSYFCWASFFTSFLMVVNDLDVTKASYVANVYNVFGTFCFLLVGLVIRQTGHFRAICLWVGIPASILGLGLMIHFRQPDQPVGYIVLCQLIVAFGFGIVMICDEVAVMAAASHQHVAVVFALEGLFSSIGGAVGLTVSSAIWQSVFPEALARYLPEADQANFDTIYGDLEMQLSFPVGSDTRIAIQHAYGDAQRALLIAGTAVWVVGFAAVWAWRDINVKATKQTKGTVI